MERYFLIIGERILQGHEDVLTCINDPTSAGKRLMLYKKPVSPRLVAQKQHRRSEELLRTSSSTASKAKAKALDQLRRKKQNVVNLEAALESTKVDLELVRAAKDAEAGMLVEARRQVVGLEAQVRDIRSEHSASIHDPQCKKACRFHFKKGGCKKGELCQWCHHRDHGELAPPPCGHRGKRGKRRKAKHSTLQQMNLHPIPVPPASLRWPPIACAPELWRRAMALHLKHKKDKCNEDEVFFEDSVSIHSQRSCGTNSPEDSNSNPWRHLKGDTLSDCQACLTATQEQIVGFSYYDPESRTIHDKDDCRKIRGHKNLQKYASQGCTRLCGPCGEIVRLSVDSRIHSQHCQCVFVLDKLAFLCSSCIDWW